MGSYGSIILIVVMIIAFYFLIMRPQRKRQQQQAQLINAIEPGSRVVTTTGIYATVIAVGDKQIVLETAPGTRVTMLKQAVGRVVQDGEEDASLAGYRGGVAPEPTGSVTGDPVENGGVDSGQSQPGASGMAGGAPIQEYTPGSAPDFSAPDYSNPEGSSESEPEQPQPHETAPWPPYGSSLGDSSLGRKDDDSTGTKGNDTDR